LECNLAAQQGSRAGREGRWGSPSGGTGEGSGYYVLVRVFTGYVLAGFRACPSGGTCGASGFKRFMCLLGLGIRAKMHMKLAAQQAGKLGSGEGRGGAAFQAKQVRCSSCA
jgi:hypothetical protein